MPFRSLLLISLLSIGSYLCALEPSFFNINFSITDKKADSKKRETSEKTLLQEELSQNNKTKATSSETANVFTKKPELETRLTAPKKKESDEYYLSTRVSVGLSILSVVLIYSILSEPLH